MHDSEPIIKNLDLKTIQHLKLLFLIHWKEAGKWDLYQAVMGRVEKLDVLQPFGLNRFQSQFWNRLTYILSEFYLPLVALRKRDSYDIVISWSMRLGICYGILNRLFRQTRKPKHIIYDFHIDLTRIDWFYRFRLKLLRFAIPGIDFFFITSESEKTIYSKKFMIKSEQMAFWPISPAGYLLEKARYPKGDYIFSYGNSDRDYDTLINAVEDIPVKTFIVSKNYKPSRTLPAHVHLFREKPWEELLSLIGSARIVAIPLQSFRISAGQLSMMEALSLERPLVITANMATVEYATEWETALFYDAGDTEKLKSHIQFLLTHPEFAEKMGNRAKIAIAKNAERRLKLFIEVLYSFL